MTTKKAPKKVKKDPVTIEEVAKEADKIVEDMVESLIGVQFLHGTRKARVSRIDDQGMCIATKKPDRTRVKCPDLIVRVTPKYVELNKI